MGDARTASGEKVKAITVDQMRELDRVAIEEFHIPLEVMMEHAGRACGLLAGRESVGDRFLVLAGAGNNGGGGLAAARHIHNAGAMVDVALMGGRYEGVPARQLRMLEGAGAAIRRSSGTMDLGGWDLIIDAMVGYGLEGGLRGLYADMARAVNESSVPVLALDVPSGLNGDTGVPGDPCVRARWTMTLALPKVGLLQRAAAESVGSLYLADIAIPPGVYRRFEADRPPFRGEPYVEIEPILRGEKPSFERVI